MTREETIERLERLKRSCHELAICAPNGKSWELQEMSINMALDALRGPTREMVERLRAELEQARTDCAVAEKNHADCIDELEQVKREFDGICEYIDSEGFLRKQFCENGNPDFEPCICPSLQEHPGYIDSDDCEGCDHFCNSWRGQKED